MSTRTISCTVPVRTKNTSNAREHHHAKASRLKTERGCTAIFCRQALTPLRGLRVVSVTFTRLSSGLLDEGDNLPNAIKAVRDEVAKLLGVNDGPKGGVQWLYAQRQIARTALPAVVVDVVVDDGLVDAEVQP